MQLSTEISAVSNAGIDPSLPPVRPTLTLGGYICKLGATEASKAQEDLHRGPTKRAKVTEWYVEKLDTVFGTPSNVGAMALSPTTVL
jgi:hypothetical protein